MRNLCVYLFLVLAVISMRCEKDDNDEPTTPNDQVTTNDFLASSKYDKLVIEIQYVAGFAPTAAAIANLKSFLEQRLNKPAGITIVQTEIASPGNTLYSATDIRNIEKANRTQNTADKTLTAYLLFVDADYSGNSGDSKVLGIAYDNTSMAIFEETVKEFSGGISEPSAATLESTVMLHEFGHILGLVNNGSTLQTAHQDTPHGKHCNNENCLMYYTAETSDIVANLFTGGTIPELDIACIADLQANGGK
jgi:predicted Zn-dependent protease